MSDQERDIEPLLDYLRASRDYHLKHVADNDLWEWHGGMVAAYERSIVAIYRWHKGKNPDPGAP